MGLPPMEAFLEATLRSGSNEVRPVSRNLETRLLAYLRDRFEDDRIDFASPPAEMRGVSEILTFRFRISPAPPPLEPSLVMRLHLWRKSVLPAIEEGAVQNALARLGYPVPPVYTVCTDTSVLGGAFLVMRFLPGRLMLSSALETMPEMLGRAQAELHEFDPTPVVEALRAQGLDPARRRLASELEGLRALSRSDGRLAPVADWLAANRPPEPGRLSICHGDFHPMNILVSGGETTGVLDWSDFMVADPALDVASTLLLIRHVSRHLLSMTDLDRRIERYLAAYRAVRPLDPDYLDYYRIRRGALVLSNARARPAIWSHPRIVEDLIADIRRTTGIAIADE